MLKEERSWIRLLVENLFNPSKSLMILPHQPRSILSNRRHQHFNRISPTNISAGDIPSSNPSRSVSIHHLGSRERLEVFCIHRQPRKRFPSAMHAQSQKPKMGYTTACVHLLRRVQVSISYSSPRHYIATHDTLIDPM